MDNTPTAAGREQALARIRHKLALLPDQPGCYLMKNEEGKIIYVGKAKVLKNRVRSYFSGSHDGKTQKMVAEIRDFEYIVTASNTECLILECNLIKEHFPRYNVLLKDDKSFPYIKITHEKHPKLEVTRRVVKDRGKYFGPYPNAFAAQETKKLLDRLYPLRKCNTLPDKVCLYYHLGQCVAPCEFPVESGLYDGMIGAISRFLNGGHSDIKRELKRKMEAAAEELAFERAREYRDQIVAIEALMEKQTINTHDVMDRDVFGYAVDKGWMSVQILYMRQGKMSQRHISVFPYYGEAYDDFLSYVTQYYCDNPALPREVLLPAPPHQVVEQHPAKAASARPALAAVAETAGTAGGMAETAAAAAGTAGTAGGMAETAVAVAGTAGTAGGMAETAVAGTAGTVGGMAETAVAAAGEKADAAGVGATGAEGSPANALPLAAEQAEEYAAGVGATGAEGSPANALPLAAEQTEEYAIGAGAIGAAERQMLEAIEAEVRAVGGAEQEVEEGEAAEVGETLRKWLKIKVTVPVRGKKRQLVAMACDNSRVVLEEKFRLIERDESRSVGAANGLAAWLGIRSADRIEAFDNSNMQGASPVSAMVVFTDGKPDKKEYRKYNVRSVQGPDDYETMREVVRRRYERVLKEGLPLPDLIVVDGGRGHISAALDVLVNELGLDVPVCGLAKDAKHRTAQLLVGDPPEAIPLPRDSQEFYLLQRIQDEVHRFAITFHREKRGKSMVASRLDAIPGIGEARRKQLLKHFGSLKAIKEANVADFRAVSIGEALATRILEALNAED